jgi:hypothetical protein
MSLTEVEVPSGGRAWVRTRLSHERDTAHRAVIAGLYRAIEKVEKLAEGELTDLPDLTRQIGEAQVEIIRLCVHHWDGVRDPDDASLLSFPEDVGRADAADIEALFRAVEEALASGRADPNASREPSASG